MLTTQGWTHSVLWAPLLLILIFVSCTRKLEEPDPSSLIRSVKAEGHIISPDSLADPKSIRTDESKLTRIVAGKPKIAMVRSNVHAAGVPMTLEADSPSVHTPGSDSLLLPGSVPIKIIEAPFREPEVTVAKDRVGKDRNPYSFSSFGKLQGLKHNVINCLIQDEMGNIWIGSSGGGATKYDGKYFTHYNEGSGLLNNAVLSMAQDRSGNIWFGTEEGVSVYDGLSFFTITDETGLTNTAVYDILEDRAGNIWFVCLKGIMKYTPHDAGKTDSVRVSYFSVSQGLPHSDVRDLFEDNSGNIWVAMRGGGVCMYDGHSFNHLGTQQGLPNAFIECVVQDRDGNLWFGTNGSGVIKYDKQHFFTFTHIDALSNNNVFSISTDRAGNIWFCTLGGGVVKYDGLHFTHFTTSDGLSDNSVISFLEDSSGNLWMGTDGGGVNLFQGNAFIHYTELDGLGNNSVFSILKDNKKQLWFGTYGGGACSYDGVHFTHYTEKEGLSQSVIYSMAQDRKGDLWFGTNGGGLTRFDGQRFIHYNTTNGLCNDVVLSITEDKQSNIWIGTRGGGISMFVPDAVGKGGTFTNYNTSSGLSSDNVYAIKEDRNGQIWIGTGQGATRFDGTGFTHYGANEGLSDAYILSILEDHNGNLWFGTMGEGVIRYDGQYFIHLTEKEGLSNNVVLSLGEDQSGDIWLGTRFGLSRLRFHTSDSTSASPAETLPQFTFKNYGYEDGFLGVGCWRNAMFIDEDNVVYIGSNDRLTLHYPGRGEIQNSTPVVRITSLDLYNEHIDWSMLSRNKDTTLLLGNGVALRDFRFDSIQRWYPLPQNLELSYRNNFINFNFIGISTYQPALIRYQYKLDGLDEHWSAITHKNNAPYGNLSHGTYRFIVRAISSTGDWSEPFSYVFTIRPPWWKTWWAYGSYLLLFILSAWRIHLALKAYTIRKEREKTQRRELEQAKEIEKAYQELKATQAQLVHAEKMASLGELTAGIAHEIQNPLNFVNNFSEVNSELIEELKVERQKANSDRQEDIEDALLNDISRNLEKISFHGRRADQIVKSMLQHSRSSSSQKELTDINLLADEYLRLAYHGYRAKDKTFNVHYETDFDPSLPKLNVVPQDVGRVLLNLFNNAFYACNEKVNGQRFTANEKSEANSQQPLANSQYQPTVVMSTRSLGNKIEIRVKDNGNGIPQSVLDKIFQPFFTTKPTGQGTGLGLSISYDIIKVHGGELKVETKEGEGTEFRILLPIQ